MEWRGQEVYTGEQGGKKRVGSGSPKAGEIRK